MRKSVQRERTRHALSNLDQRIGTGLSLTVAQMKATNHKQSPHDLSYGNSTIGGKIERNCEETLDKGGNAVKGNL